MRTFNVLDAEVSYDDADPDGYRGGMARFGDSIGATEIGGSLYELEPGQALCPYHYESDEEWLIVLAGHVTVRHPEGEDVLGPGDVTAFPVGPVGAHKTTNAGAETVRMLMLSTKRMPAYSVYPDSNKVGLWTGQEEDDVLVRRGQSLDYYDGEAG